MNRILFLSIIINSILLFTSPDTCMAQKTQEVNSERLFKTFQSGEVCYTIGDEYAGEFILGEEIPKQEYLEHFTIRKETNKNDHSYIISEKKNKIIQLIPKMLESDYGSIEIIKEIRVIADKFKTPKGITVNSKVEDLIKVYPSCHISYFHDEDFLAFESDETEAKFLISKSDYIGSLAEIDEMAKVDISKYKPHSKIIEVRLF